jgi:hypothetical protein
MVNDMIVENSTDVRKDWSLTVDGVIREKPKFIKRTHDYMLLSNLDVIENILSAYSFHATEFAESDGSVTLSLEEIDLVENAPTEQEAKTLLAKSILEYSEDFYREYSIWSSDDNRKKHIPYVFKALILNDPVKIGELISCQPGKN